MKITSFISQLSPRDKKALSFLGLFILGALVYLIWHKMDTYEQVIIGKISYNQELTDYMNENKAKIKQIKDQKKPISQKPLFSEVSDAFSNQSQNPLNAELSRVSETKISVNIKKIQFAKLLKQLNYLSTQDIIVEKISVKRLKEPGWVKAELIVAR